MSNESEASVLRRMMLMTVQAYKTMVCDHRCELDRCNQKVFSDVRPCAYLCACNNGTCKLDELIEAMEVADKYEGAWYG